MDLYDQFLYTPLQTSLLPVVCKIPRTVILRNKTYTVFTANIVSYSRTLLVIPIAVCLKYGQIAPFFLNILPLLGSFSLEINFLNIWFAIYTQGTSTTRLRFYWSSCTTSWITWMGSWLKLTDRCSGRLTIHCWADSWTHSVTRLLLKIFTRFLFFENCNRATKVVAPLHFFFKCILLIFTIEK